MAAVLGVLKVAQNSVFLEKPLTKDTAQMALCLVCNESAKAKLLCALISSRLSTEILWVGHKLGY